MVARKLAVPRRTIWVYEEAVWFPCCVILESRRKKKTCEMLEESMRDSCHSFLPASYSGLSFDCLLLLPSGGNWILSIVTAFGRLFP